MRGKPLAEEMRYKSNEVQTASLAELSLNFEISSLRSAIANARTVAEPRTNTKSADEANLLFRLLNCDDRSAMDSTASADHRIVTDTVNTYELFSD